MKYSPLPYASPEMTALLKSPAGKLDFPETREESVLTREASRWRRREKSSDGVVALVLERESRWCNCRERVFVSTSSSSFSIERESSSDRK